jgi:excisionase family DNA binding protein
MPGYRAAANDADATGPTVLLRAEEAARLLRISRTAVFKLLASGELRSITIGRRRRIPRAALDDYVQNRLVLAKSNGSRSGR